MLRDTGQTIAGYQCWRMADFFESLRGGLNQVWIDIDTDDILPTEPVRQQRGVVTCAGTYFQHTMTVVEV